MAGGDRPGAGQEDTIPPVRPSHTHLCEPFIESLLIDRAALMTLGTPFDVETISTSDDRAAELSELQLDAGEGPCWDAYSTATAVLAPDLASVPSSTWPVISSALSALDVRAVYSLPLAIGTLKIGAVDLYADTPDTLSADDLARAWKLAASASADVLSQALERRGDDASEDGPYSRREVHQATGMVIAQMRVSAEDALLLIRAHAFASGRTVRETAADITTRRITLAP
ncbi:GAF and ANTAR domain-containing protein [Herbiconiux sp. YIM B11900]|uniref:GAF and ANTAR domain-containing protein n=1 Tax=Herbiconiux sp. YIM B11900 TaxID=3404131 RepID=UPI003F8340D0